MMKRIKIEKGRGGIDGNIKDVFYITFIFDDEEDRVLRFKRNELEGLSTLIDIIRGYDGVTAIGRDFTQE